MVSSSGRLSVLSLIPDLGISFRRFLEKPIRCRMAIMALQASGDSKLLAASGAHRSLFERIKGLVAMVAPPIGTLERRRTTRRASKSLVARGPRQPGQGAGLLKTSP